MSYHKKVTLPLVLDFLASARVAHSALEVAKMFVSRYPPDRPEKFNATVRSIVGDVAAKLIVASKAGLVNDMKRPRGHKARSELVFSITSYGHHFLSGK